MMNRMRSCSSADSRRALCAALAALVLISTAASARALTDVTAGNLVVARIGDGSSALTSAATRVFLDEYALNGTLVQTFALPTVAAGANRAVTSSGSATSEGALTFSADGQYLIYGGYDAAVGTTSVASTTSVAVNRVIARISRGGVIDSTTALTDAFSVNNIRGAVSVDGTSFWASGPGGSPRFAILGDTASTLLVAGLNSRNIDIYGGQLYISTAAGARFGVCTVGTGLPTGTGETVTLLAGFPTATGPSSYDFVFANPSTLYVADDRTIANGGGVQKWTESAGTWSLAYTLAPAGTQGCRGLTGVVNAGVATLYATTTATNANLIVTVTDTGASSTFSTVAQAPAATVFRGLRLVPGSAAPQVTVYCTAGTTTNNCVPAISGVGAPSISAGSGFSINVSSVEGQKIGLMFYGVTGANALSWGSGSTSFLCIKSPTQRLSSQNSGGTAGACGGAYSQDFNAFLAANPTALGQPFSSGDTVWAQAWFRDPPAPKTTNLSDGLEFVLQP